MGDLPSAFVTGASNVFGAGISAASNAVEAKKQREWTQKENEKQRQWQQEENQRAREYERRMWDLNQQATLAQWQRQNDYDSPTAQMNRFRAAGLNPNLIYGEMGAGSPADIPAAPMNGYPDQYDYRTDFGPANFGQSIQMLVDAPLRAAQVANLDAQTEKTKEDTKGVSIDNYYRAAEHEQSLQIGDVTLMLSKEDLKKKPHEIELLIKTIEKTGAEFLELNKRIDVYSAQIANLDADTKAKIGRELRDNQIFKHQVNLLIQQARHFKALADYNENDLREAIETFTLRKLGLEAEVEYESSSIASRLAIDFNNAIISDNAATISSNEASSWLSNGVWYGQLLNGVVSTGSSIASAYYGGAAFKAGTLGTKAFKGRPKVGF